MTYVYVSSCHTPFKPSLKLRKNLSALLLLSSPPLPPCGPPPAHISKRAATDYPQCAQPTARIQ